MRDASAITGFHAHVYFDTGTRDVASTFRDGIAARFVTELGSWHDRPIGPHSQPMYQVAFTTELFASIVPWMMLNRQGLTILVHPMTGDHVEDHVDNSLWLGAPLPLDVEFLRNHP